MTTNPHSIGSWDLGMRSACARIAGIVILGYAVALALYVGTWAAYVAKSSFGDPFTIVSDVLR